MKKVLLITFSLLVVVTIAAAIGNPTPKEFEEFVSKSQGNTKTVRLHNYYVYSIYKVSSNDGIDSYQATYAGYFWSFSLIYQVIT